MNFRITYHGVEHEQYFLGHGIAFTDYTDTTTGVGDTPGEALDDALEQLACKGYLECTLETIGASPEAEALYASKYRVDTDFSEDHHCYVSVDIGENHET